MGADCRLLYITTPVLQRLQGTQAFKHRGQKRNLVPAIEFRPPYTPLNATIGSTNVACRAGK
jgi:hypothetical protein